MDQVVNVLRQLRSWEAEDLIDRGEFEQKREQLVSCISFPCTINASTAKLCLVNLKNLKEDGLVTASEFKQKKAEVLAAMTVDNVTEEGAKSFVQRSEKLDVSDLASRQQGSRSSTDKVPKPVAASGDTTAASGQGHENDNKYFGCYADFAHQELMLNDVVRTSTYQRGILQNRADFENKVVIDVGAGTGILSMFAAQAGARRVYAVEASAMALTAEKVIVHNGFSHVITVVKGKVEEVNIPEQADIIISEPLGFWLINEQMIQSYIVARDRWLKPSGKMFPSYSKFFIAPCYVPETRKGTILKSTSWLTKQDFHGLDFTCAELDCRKQNMERMIVDQVFPSQVVGPATASTIDFTTISVAGLDNMTLPFKWENEVNTLWDSVGFWFDTFFVGSGSTICLSTRPNEKLTCWYQTLCLLKEPILSRNFSGYVTFDANSERTYDVALHGGSEEKDYHALIQNYGFTLPVYRYYDHFQDLIWDITQYPELRAGVAPRNTGGQNLSDALPWANNRVQAAPLPTVFTSSSHNAVANQTNTMQFPSSLAFPGAAAEPNGSIGGQQIPAADVSVGMMQDGVGLDAACTLVASPEQCPDQKRQKKI
jgi:histone-arginine methyltransferase CARM1